MLDKQSEECGVVAVYRPKAVAAELVHRALFALQHRGQEAAGIATHGGDGQIMHLRARGLVAEALPIYKVKELSGESAIGHVRYSTVSMDQTENIQPFLATTPFGRFAVAHNGNFKNADAMHSQLEQSGALIATTLDTELFVHLLARSGASDLGGALKYAASQLIGAFSLTMICNGRLYALRDSHGVRPLVLGELAEGGYVIASETCALDAVVANYIREINPGELVEIGPNGVTSIQLLEPAPKPAPCIFELVYFARPDSNVFSQNVHAARTSMGEELAQADLDARPAGDLADIVVPVPDSGFPAAIGYSRRSGIPLEKAIIRSHYIGRTFILPDQDSRTHSLRLKLSVIRAAVKDKRVLLVDDSIVRGNTSAQIVQMVREAGARSVHMRIASPPLAWPCYLGIDTPNRNELVINRHTNEDGVAKFIGVDDLRYLKLDALVRAAGGGSFCKACMDGKYPV